MAMWPVLALMLLTGCCKLLPRHTVTLADYGIAIEVPADWQMQENISGLRWYARPTNSGKTVAGAYLTLMRDNAGELTAPGTPATLSRYVEFKLEQEGRNALSHAVLTNNPVLVGGRSGALLLTEYASETYHWRTQSLLLMEGDYGYALSATASAADAAALQAAYSRTLSSLRFTRPPAEKP